MTVGAIHLYCGSYDRTSLFFFLHSVGSHCPAASGSWPPQSWARRTLQSVVAPVPMRHLESRARLSLLSFSLSSISTASAFKMSAFYLSFHILACPEAFFDFLTVISARKLAGIQLPFPSLASLNEHTLHFTSFLKI